MPAIASNPKCYHLSASAIAAFKACPTRFRLAYREGIRTQDDTESQRVGTNWHEMHEVYAANGNDLEAVVSLLNDRYANPPASKTADEWALERQILLTSFVGYQWYYANDPVEVLASEVPFELPLTSPRTGLPLPVDEVVRVGKIDHIVRWQGAVCALERKSTSRAIGADSDYWEKAQKDTQVSQYSLAFRNLIPFANTLSATVFGPFFELPLSQGKVAIVDESDRVLVERFSWHAWESRGKWYAATNINQGDGYAATRLHRVLIGEIEEGEIIDHINGDSLDNRRCNLRVTSQSVNRLNADTRGTSFHRATGKWTARLTLDGRTRSLGYFDSEDAAHAAYVEAKAAVLPNPYARFGNTLYDVYHRPTIKPTTLTQTETIDFIGDQQYYGQKFAVGCHVNDVFWKDRIPLAQREGETVEYFVNGEKVETTWGKSGKPAIKETIEMYGARLLADIMERPDFYFQRREIARTDAELEQFQRQLYATYQSMKAAAKHGAWIENESACRATFACPFIPICYSGAGADGVCDGSTTPPGFKRIFVDPTINGQPIEGD